MVSVDLDELTRRTRFLYYGLLTREEQSRLLADLVVGVASLKDAGLGSQDPLRMQVLERACERTVEQHRKLTRPSWWQRLGKNAARWNPDTLRWERT